VIVGQGGLERQQDQRENRATSNKPFHLIPATDPITPTGERIDA
jgi:hypothetical protein